MRTLHKLRQDDRGATIIEFGLLLPVILGTFLGVVQIGMSMLAHNSLRNATAEASRYALVEYQNSNVIDYTTIENAVKTEAPNNGLVASKLTVKVTKPATQRVSGAIELQIATSYKTTSVLPFFGLDDYDTTYSRPLFLIDES